MTDIKQNRGNLVPLKPSYDKDGEEAWVELTRRPGQDKARVTLTLPVAGGDVVRVQLNDDIARTIAREMAATAGRKPMSGFAAFLATAPPILVASVVPSNWWGSIALILAMLAAVVSILVADRRQ